MGPASEQLYRLAPQFPALLVLDSPGIHRSDKPVEKSSSLRQLRRRGSNDGIGVDPEKLAAASACGTHKRFAKG